MRYQMNITPLYRRRMKIQGDVLITRQNDVGTLLLESAEPFTVFVYNLEDVLMAEITPSGMDNAGNVVRDMRVSHTKAGA